MRPFRRPGWEAAWGRWPLVDVVLQELGRYCAACERRLTVGAHLWDVRTGALLGGHSVTGAWEHVLPLCAECAAAAEGRPAGDELLLPDRHDTFALDETSPFRYERPGAVAVVTATTERARATLLRFGLDAPFPGDPRPELRTTAWAAAEAHAGLLRSEDGTLRALVPRQVRVAAEHLGFWSVWATVLWRELGDLDRLADVLLPPSAAGRAPHFPNTRTSWLPGGVG